MDRRKFLELSSLGTLALALGNGLDASAAELLKKPRKKGVAADSASAGGKYSVVILGDTHYDCEPKEVYHEGYYDPKPTREALHWKEIDRNIAMWKTRCPKILDRARNLVDPDTKMFFQMGDLIQGDTSTAEIHKMMLNDTINFLKSHLAALPFVTVVGNHDVRGVDDAVAGKAYREYMNSRMGAELGRVIASNNFSFRIGPDAYIVADFNNPDDDEVAKLLTEAEDARYIFFISHGPVFPYQSVKYHKWYYHGRDKDPQARERMRGLLAQHNVIVLCGHTHSTEFCDWRGDGGRISQMTMTSVWAKESQGRYVPDADKVEDYRLEGKEELFAPVRAGMTAYEHADSCGCYRLNVSDDGVTVDFYAGGSEDVSRTFVLR